MATSGSGDEAQSSVAGEVVYFSVLREYLQQGRNARLSLVVVGEAGQGKSSLINGLLGEEIAEEGDDLDSATESVQAYTYTQNQVHVTLWDTPGFGMDDEGEWEEETLRKIARDGGRIDLLLYCIRMDSTRWPKRSDVETIQKFTAAFEGAIWRHSLFVLTFANVMPRLCPRGKDVSQYFTDQTHQWEAQIHQTLIRYAGVSEEEARAVAVVPVGDPRSNKSKKILWSLPDREDWFSSFWVHCTRQMRQRSLQSLLQLNSHRCIDTTADESSMKAEKKKEKGKEEKSVQDCGDHREVVEERTGSDTDEVYARPIPIFSIIINQLRESESDFRQYVSAFAAEHGRSGVGRVAGFIEGMSAWAVAKCTKVLLS